MLPNLNLGRHSHSSLYLNGSIYVFGGFIFDDNKDLYHFDSTIEVFDFRTFEIMNSIETLKRLS
jgi:hypothetical protein